MIRNEILCCEAFKYAAEVVKKNLIEDLFISKL